MRPAWTITAFCILAFATTAGAQVVLEGFEDGNISEYVATGPVNTAVTAAAAHDGMYGLAFAGIGGGEGWIYRDDAAVHVQQGDRISWWTQTNASTFSRNYLGFGATAGGCYSAVLGVNTSSFMIQYNSDFGFSNLVSVPQTYQARKWYRVEVDWGVGGTITAYLFDSDGMSLLNSAVAAHSAITSGGLAFRCFDNGDPGYFDTVMLMNPVSVEAASWGSIKALYR